MFQLIVFAVIITAFVSGNPANKIQARVLNGNPAEEGQFPYQVSIQIKGQHFCGGSIIDNYHIITAAHCVENVDLYDLSVLAGTVNVHYGNRYGVLSYIQHPQYDSKTVDYDVAIIYLASDILEDNNPNIQPIKLVEQSDSVKPGDYVTLSGWGQDSPNLPDFLRDWYQIPQSSPEHLQYARIPIWKRSECHAALINENPLTPRMFCAGSYDGQISSCPGDSGGPLVKGNKLVGIVSWGLGCGADAPAVYTKVVALRKWIDDVLQNDAMSSFYEDKKFFDF